VNRGNGKTLLKEKVPNYGLQAKERSTGREREMLRKPEAEQRKGIAPKAAKAPWDEKRREEP